MKRDENHFVRQERKASPTDIVLAKCYYPILKELAANQRKMTFGEFVDTAKAAYPNIPEVKSAIPVTTGRRFEFIRLYLKENNLPDLSAWVVNSLNENSDAYLKDFDAEAERQKTTKIDWSQYEGGDWGKYVEAKASISAALKRRSEAEAIKVMGEYWKNYRDKIPNLKNLPLYEISKLYREAVIEGLMEGKDVEAVYEDAYYDLNHSRSAEA